VCYLVRAKLFQKVNQLLSRASAYRRVALLPYGATFIWKQPVLISSILITGFLLGVRQLEILQPLELREFDRATQLKPEKGLDPRILLVEITEADIQAQKEWPLSDQTVAKLIAKLQSYQPKVIGLDIYRDLSHPPGNTELQKQLQARNIIVINKLGDNGNNQVSPPPGVPKERIGFNDFVLDPDGVIRRNFIYAAINEEKYYSFALRVSQSYLRDKQLGITVDRYALYLGKTAFPVLENNSAGYQNIDAQGYQILLNYRSRNVARRVRLTQVLNGRLNRDWVKDKVVLIGTTAPSLKDMFFTPYNANDQKKATMPGVIIHAQMVSQILSTVLDEQPITWYLPQWLEWFWVWFWSLIGAVLVWRFRHPVTLAFAAILAIGGLFGICFAGFLQGGWIPFYVPALALVITGGSGGIYRRFHDACYDSLTGLPNRALFLKQVQNAIAHIQKHNNSLVALIFLDLDGFKVVNDSFGHQGGDRLLLAVTKRLKGCLRPIDTLARIGEDEFAILLSVISDVSQATVIADKIQNKLSLPFNINGQEIFTTASFGIALNAAGKNQQSGELLRDAHTAMYRAKILGKARYEVFSSSMRTQIVNRLQLETDLRRAIAFISERKNQVFALHYQLIVSLKTGKIAGFEVLVRWQHQGKFISPVEFIPVAEETGLIIPLGEWILTESCRQWRVWQEQFPMYSPLMLSVNISSQQFSQPDLTERIEQILKTTGMDGNSLKLEITESMAMKDVESTIATILRLKALKMRFSIDDFGTGYSSLSYLHRFPVDTLKVDRSFVSRMDETSEDRAIVQSIIMLGHNLGMDVVAEGVETAEQMQRLRALQCDYGQGYFFSKPLNSEAATALLATNPQWLIE